jgi:hypothetical protein
MSEKAQRYSKRQVQRQIAGAVKELNGRADKVKGEFIITPRTAMKGYTKWTAAIRRAVRPLAEQFGLKVVADNGKVVYS